MIADKIEIFAETSLMILLLVYLFFLMSLLNPMTMLKYFYYFVGCIVNFIVSYLICMFQDSVPTGSYNDPFLSSVCVVCLCVSLCVCVCGSVCVCVFGVTNFPSHKRSQNQVIDCSEILDQRCRSSLFCSIVFPCSFRINYDQSFLFLLS